MLQWSLGVPLVYKVKDLGEDVGIFPRVGGSFIKYMGLLEYCTLLGAGTSGILHPIPRLPC